MNFYKHTDVGVVRAENQDRADYFEKGNVALAILCDGMGGHYGGSIASSITIDVFKNHFENQPPRESENLYNWFERGLRAARERMIIEAGNSVEKIDMGTTVVAALFFINSRKIFIFNVGDSRAYVYNGLLHQVSIDHNLMNYYIRNEKMKPEEAAKILSATALTSALGPQKKTNLEVFEINEDSKVKALILTSDGVHDYIQKPMFEQVIASNSSLEVKSKELIKKAILGKSTDNLTVLIVEVK
ncbi:PP2C family serine/threonine-protein phosphatase [Mycoplasmopsis agassizii]|uniref:Serine/threonine-protein phosphatase n=1 Tax=Mycoplasmopsis agassizii TaxID=33922 RepID=A0ABX4H4W9_9BACT|nr:PP2C family serine/threonine-protein phosphatase [Mycoplasmopsis agassizii]PAF54934.1 serine/threonine-protein phosphatase [Mycoplasmopsis agassizii]SMC17084.1 protein phosphatase [Mycoplasmopsis agassizii]